MPGDYFDTAYQGAYKSGLSLGEGIQSAAGSFAKPMEEKKKQQQAYNTLKAAGMIKENITPPSDDELKKGLEDYAKQGGISQVNWMESDDPKETRNSLEGTYKALGIPLPKGKTTIDYNLAPGTKYKVNDNLVMDAPADKSPLDALIKMENLKYLQGVNKQMSGAGEDNLVYRKASTGEMVPNDVAQKDISQGNKDYIVNRKEISKSGVKETPVLSTADQKFRMEQEDNQKAQQQKSQLVLDNAKDTLDTISQVEKGIGNFGLTGGLPSIPGTDRYVWQTNVDKLLSGKIIDVMTKMKEASKTGSTGFGQLSNKELDVLKNASTALKKGLPPEEAQKYLNDMKVSIKKVLNGNQTSQTQQSNDPEYQKYLQTIGQ